MTSVRRCLVDSDILIDGLRKVEGAGEYLDSLGDWSYSIASGMELFFGARSKKEMQAIEKSLASYQRIGFSPEIGELALDIVKKYAKSDGTSEFDAIIAATAMTSGFTLATRNQKHFRMSVARFSRSCPQGAPTQRSLRKIATCSAAGRLFLSVVY